MFPTKIDLWFWQARQPKPSWVGLIPKPKTAVPDHWKHDPYNVDAVTNAHAGVKDTEGERAAVSLLSLLKSVRRRGGDLAGYLAQIASQPGTVIGPKKRRAFAVRWSKRLRRRK